MSSCIEILTHMCKRRRSVKKYQVDFGTPEDTSESGRLTEYDEIVNYGTDERLQHNPDRSDQDSVFRLVSSPEAVQRSDNGGDQRLPNSDNTDDFDSFIEMATRRSAELGNDIEEYCTYTPVKSNRGTQKHRPSAITSQPTTDHKRFATSADGSGRARD